jgi:hypothetical protein
MEVEIAYDLSLRGLERQPAILADLRTRAAALLAGVGVVATLFAPKAFDPGISQGAKIAYILGGVATGLCLAMCWPIFRSIYDDGNDDVERYVQLREDGTWPSEKELRDCRRKWRSTINLSALTCLHQVIADRSPCVELASFIAIWRRLNWEQIKVRSTCFNFAAVFFAVEVICGIVGLAYG